MAAEKCECVLWLVPRNIPRLSLCLPRSYSVRRKVYFRPSTSKTHNWGMRLFPFLPPPSLPLSPPSLPLPPPSLSPLPVSLSHPHPHALSLSRSHTQTEAEISKVEQEIQGLEQSLAEKTPPMMVVQTRLENRTYRPNVELCRDTPQYGMVREVAEIANTQGKLREKLEVAE